LAKLVHHGVSLAITKFLEEIERGLRLLPRDRLSARGFLASGSNRSHVDALHLGPVHAARLDPFEAVFRGGSAGITPATA
jgi:hypothetical protein